jgi:tRNA(adenine34) deaminase
MNHEPFMKEALLMAESALKEGEFPVGCVIVHRDAIVATGRRTHTREHSANETDHAEINALKHLYSLTRQPDRNALTVYATMEPCLMCFAAIILSGIRRIVYAYEDAMGGGTACDLTALPPLYRDAAIDIVPHVMRKESLELFKRFFQSPENAYWKGSYLEAYTLSAS